MLSCVILAGVIFYQVEFYNGPSRTTEYTIPVESSAIVRTNQGDSITFYSGPRHITVNLIGAQKDMTTNEIIEDCVQKAVDNQ